MSKSKPKSFRSNRWNEEYDDYGTDYRSNEQRRREKRMKNLIRSKNVDRLMKMDDDENEDT